MIKKGTDIAMYFDPVAISAALATDEKRSGLFSNNFDNWAGESDERIFLEAECNGRCLT